MILDMIATGDFGLAGWEFVGSSEQGMLAEVGSAIGDEARIVFLGWAPHPMNAAYPLEYLSSGDAGFGPNYGGAEVMTNIRAGFDEVCPNVARLVSNLRFTPGRENEMTGAILDHGADPRDAAVEWLRANPDAVTAWLDGITILGGGDAGAAVATMLEE